MSFRFVNDAGLTDFTRNTGGLPKGSSGAASHRRIAGPVRARCGSSKRLEKSRGDSAAGMAGSVAALVIPRREGYRPRTSARDDVTQRPGSTEFTVN